MNARTNQTVNVPAILSLILSIGSLCCCCMWHLALLGAVGSVLLGIFGLTGRKTRGKDMAIAGIVVGSVALILAVVSAGMMIFITSNGG
ncbi:MAG: hypothetical protein IKQ97_05005 [Eubacterium sp.]|nr:hypothetical protein [Eubacterium sp.]